jgi:hypothetical protein
VVERPQQHRHRLHDQNTTLGAGGTTSVGFVGAYSGPNVAPGVFALNGTVCRTG